MNFIKKTKSDILVGKWSSDDGSGFSYMYSEIIFNYDGTGTYKSYSESFDNESETINEVGFFKWKRINNNIIECNRDNSSDTEIIEFEITKIKKWTALQNRNNENTFWFFGEKILKQEKVNTGTYINFKTILIGLIIGVLLILGIEVSKNYKNKETLITRISSKIIDLNTFSIEFDENLESSDFKVVNRNNNKTIYENSVSIKGIKNDYGYRNFEIYYKNKKVIEFSHFSLNNWHSYDYKIELKKIENRITPKFKIIGVEPYRDFYYKIFMYDNKSVLRKIDYYSIDNMIYNSELITN